MIYEPKKNKLIIWSKKKNKIFVPGEKARTSKGYAKGQEDQDGQAGSARAKGQVDEVGGQASRKEERRREFGETHEED